MNSEWFITESFAVNLAYSQLDPDDIEFTDVKVESGELMQLPWALNSASKYHVSQ